MQLEWKQESIFLHIGEHVYSDERGWSFVQCKGWGLNFGKPIEHHNIYWRDPTAGGKYVPFTDFSENKIKYPQVCDLFHYEYGERTRISNGYPEKWEIRKIALKSINIRVNLYEKDAGEESGKRIDISAASETDLIEAVEKVWFCNDLKHGEFISMHPLFRDVKVGNAYYVKKHGTCKVSDVFDYPARNGIICKMQDWNGTDFPIYLKEWGDFVYELPYTITDTADIHRETEVFSESLNELLLQPIVEKSKDGNSYTVCWQEIEEAAGYTVSLYKWDNRRSGFLSVYHLKDFDLPRNEKYLSVNGLEGSGVGNVYVFVVKAEDRNGKVIAFSRGISSSGFPTYFD